MLGAVLLIVICIADISLSIKLYRRCCRYERALRDIVAEDSSYPRMISIAIRALENSDDNS